MSMKKVFFLFLLASITCLTPLLSIYIDIFILKDSLRELSVTEIMQEIILMLLVLYYCKPRGYILSQYYSSPLISGFFLCMLLRELDFLFDFIFHGAWFLCCIPVMLYCLLNMIRNHKKINAELILMSKKPFFGMMLSGMLTVLIFARIAGMDLVWRHLTINSIFYTRVIKNVIEEGLELFGYSQILFSACWQYYSIKKQ